MLPKWLLPALGTAGVSAATALFQLYTDVALLKQSDVVKDRMIYELKDRVAGIEQGKENFENEAIGKLDHLGKLLERRK